MNLEISFKINSLDQAPAHHIALALLERGAMSNFPTFTP
jgi:hypothetical protein